MTFLGIDQSLNGTGLCRILGEVIEASATVTPEGLVDGPRLVYIKQAVAGMLPGVTAAAIEGYAYDAVGRVFELGEIGGALKVLLVECGVPYIIVPPVLLKKFATGRAFASKGAMLKAAADRGALFSDDNQSDAFFLAHIARAWHTGEVEVRREMEVLRVLCRSSDDKKSRRPRRARQLIKAAI